tara:strand:- start:385 stop:729 length:345 start_codon:yes stop_codon:yes gene_type:complete
MADSCWPGYVADGKKKSPSGKKTKGGGIKMVNNCVKRGSISQLRQEATGLKLSDYSSVVSNVNDASEDAVNLVGPGGPSRGGEEKSGMSKGELRRDKRKQNKRNKSGASSRPAF